MSAARTVIRWPSALSAWWIPIIIGIAYGPIVSLGLVARFFWSPDRGSAFALGWGLTVVPACFLLLICSSVIQVVRFGAHLVDRAHLKFGRSVAK